MPKITVFEKDISDSEEHDVTENIVYVPGISTNTAEDKPSIKVCRTLSEFHEAFGNEPFTFADVQNYPSEMGGDAFLGANSEDLGFRYAEELLKVGLPVLFEDLGVTTVAGIYQKFYTEESNEVSSVFDKLIDKNEYNVKFITSGGYPTFEYTTSEHEGILMKRILEIAALRGDSTAFIDHKDLGKSGDIKESVFDKVNTIIDNTYVVNSGTSGKEESTPKYGVIVTPWAKYNRRVDTKANPLSMPGSFGYLTAYGISVQNNPNWYAVAGVNRGLLNKLAELNTSVSGAKADEVQVDPTETTGKISIIPITNVRPYGYCIWGDRTLHKNTENTLVASSLLNIRILANDVKKQIYAAAKKLMFEVNSDELFLNFKAEVEPLLDKMITGNGLRKYTIRKEATDKKATLKVIVTLYAIAPVENFDVTLEISDSEVEIQ